jgi:uncharacterized protein
MSPEERQMIAGLFERMRRFGAPEKDSDAEALIGQQIRALPDAPYMLVQSVLVQEQALENAQTRIQDLEARVQQLEGGEPPRKSGGFLGGYWGRRDEGREDARPSSVPQVGARATPPAYEGRQQPWSQPGAPPAQGAPAGGGFMRSAISTAAGVAGGMLLADSLRSMLGGHGGSPFGTASAQQHSADQAAQDAADDAAQDSADDATQDATDDAAQDAEDDAAQDAADDAAQDEADDAGDDGDDDFGGDDMDV